MHSSHVLNCDEIRNLYVICMVEEAAITLAYFHLDISAGTTAIQVGYINTNINRFQVLQM